MDFFKTTVDLDALDRAYVDVCNSEYCSAERGYLEALWREFEPAADLNFHQEMQKAGNFQGRVWEMRLAVVLKGLGLPVCMKRRKAGGPDVLITSKPKVWIEAVAPRSTADLDRNDGLARRSSAPSSEAEVILRYTQSLQAKWKAYLGYRRSRLVQAEEAYVVAVSGASLRCPTRGGGPHWMAKPLYGIGDLVFQTEVSTGRDLGSYRTSVPLRQKAAGALVDADLFLSGKRRGVCAILYTADDVLNWPELHGHVAGSDFRLFHNPFATVPLPVGFIRQGREWGVDGENLRCLNDFTSKPGTG
jgi:hypothetical protein